MGAGQERETVVGPAILVTGGAGFVGSNLIRGLLVEFPTSTIISVDNYFTGRIDNHVTDSRVSYVRASTVDIHRAWADLGVGSPETVYHLGEYSRIVQSLDENDLTWEYNLHGTKEVVNFAHAHNAKLVYAGSSSKFGNGGQDENLNPYAWTKAKNVEYIRNFSSWYGLDYVVTYFYNVYGPGHIREGKYATVIGIFEYQYEQGVPLTVVSPGTQTRDFTHIDDIVSGILLCAQKGSGDGYLLGSGRAWQMLEVAKLFSDDYVMVPALPGERFGGHADTTKVRSLGWAAQRSLDQHVAAFKADHPRPGPRA
jgi:UDP-glucose 4-epimerase